MTKSGMKQRTVFLFSCVFILTSKLEVHNRIPIGSMVAWYIYLHENHKEINHYVGKYTNIPMGIRHGIGQPDHPGSKPIGPHLTLESVPF